MRSDVPKVLHRVAGRTLVEWVVDAARDAGAGRVVAVVRPGDGVAEGLPEGVEVAEQREGEGTGRPFWLLGDRARGWGGPRSVFVLSGDQPLITAEQLTGCSTSTTGRARSPRSSRPIASIRPASGGSCATGCGHVERIFETKHTEGLSADELAAREINLGTYVFDADTLFEALDQVALEREERYLTGVFTVIRAERRHHRRAHHPRRGCGHRRQRSRRPDARRGGRPAAADRGSTPAPVSRSCSRAPRDWSQG